MGNSVLSSKFRGHEIYHDESTGHWRYCDTGEMVSEAWLGRPCGHCHKHSTPEGHDGCLGTLQRVANACCGHGNSPEAYVQFVDGREMRGQDAIDFFHTEVPQ